MKDNISQKPPVTQVPQKPTEAEPTAKQNSVSAPTQQSRRRFMTFTDVKRHVLKDDSPSFLIFLQKNPKRTKPRNRQRRRKPEERHEIALYAKDFLSSLCNTLFFFFPLFARRTLTKTFFVIGNKTFNSILEDKTAFIHMKHLLMNLWILIVDTVQSFVKWRHWFSRVDLILLIMSLTPMNLVTNRKSCIVEFRCRKYRSC